MTEETTATKPWLSAEMIQSGLTERVIDYLDNPELPVAAIGFTWKEFMTVKNASDSETFTKSKLFLEKTKTIADRKKPISDALRKTFNEVADLDDLFRDYLPIELAVTVCTSYWDFKHLLARAKNKSEIDLIFAGIRKISAQTAFEEDTVVSYCKIAQEYKTDVEIATVVMNSFLLQNPDKAIRINKEVPLSEFQIQGFMKNIDGVLKSFWDDELYKFYISTKRSDVLEKLLGTVNTEDASEFRRWIDKIESMLRNCDTASQKQEIRHLSLPIIGKLMEIQKRNRYSNWDNILDVIPPYAGKKKKADLEKVITETIKSYTNSEYGLTYDSFVKWYKFKKRAIWIELYKKSVTNWGVNRFMSTVSVAKMTKKPELIAFVINEGIPLVKNPDSDFVEFMNWLKQNDPDNYTIAKELIAKENYLEKWWRATDSYSGYLKEYVKFFKHFQ